MIRLLATGVLLALSGVASAELPRPDGLSDAVDFWKKVYTEVDTNSGYIHDRRHLGVIYEKITFPEDMSNSERQDRIDAIKTQYRRILSKLARASRGSLSEKEQRVLGLWPEDVSRETLRLARKRLRFQLGQSDKFRESLVRSGAWKPYIREVLKEQGVPEELAALPHVESSYNPFAYSKVGAAGLWQFTRATGRRYLRINHVIDERLDPYLSSRAAAQLLRHNHSVTGNWPLAITAYNHGAAGMRRAARRMGTDDIVKIVDGYRSRTFGFASRNFYAALLAAIEVDRNAREYFGELDPREPVSHETAELKAYVPADAIAQALEIEPSRLRELNSALMEPVWKGRKLIPRGYPLRLPEGAAANGDWWDTVPLDRKYLSQLPDREHRVRRGETLSGIASRYGLTVRELAAYNNLSNRHFVRIGQRLQLPGGSGEVFSLAQLSRGTTHVVESGETLSGIASRYGVPQQLLAEVNDLKNRHQLRVGQELVVAAQSAATAGTPPETGQPAGSESGPAETGTTADDEPPASEQETASEPPAEPETTEPATPNEETPAPEQDISEEAIAGMEEAEPVADAAENGEPVLPAHASPDLAADPSDYTVGEDGSIEVQAVETLGHYADWLEIRTQRLRNRNNFPFGRPVRLGEQVTLIFDEVTPEEFEARRKAYHANLQAAFFQRNRIDGTRTHVIERGDSLWTLTHQTYSTPVWLLRQYNPDVDFTDMKPGDEITVPNLREVGAD